MKRSGFRPERSKKNGGPLTSKQKAYFARANTRLLVRQRKKELAEDGQDSVLQMHDDNLEPVLPRLSRSPLSQGHGHREDKADKGDGDNNNHDSILSSGSNAVSLSYQFTPEQQDIYKSSTRTSDGILLKTSALAKSHYRRTKGHLITRMRNSHSSSCTATTSSDIQTIRHQLLSRGSWLRTTRPAPFKMVFASEPGVSNIARRRNTIQSPLSHPNHQNAKGPLPLNQQSCFPEDGRYESRYEEDIILDDDIESCIDMSYARRNRPRNRDTVESASEGDPMIIKESMIGEHNQKIAESMLQAEGANEDARAN